jgi:NitT/TauT family transport system ATP-binding protein
MKSSAVFQDDCLCEDLTAVENIKMCTNSSEEVIIDHLASLIGNEVFDLNVDRLSGGMRRRVCIVRAMLASSNIVILDEPFKGLDEINITKCARYILQYLNTRTLIYTAHDRVNDILNGDVFLI